MYLAWSPVSKSLASREYRGDVRLYIFEEPKLQLLLLRNHYDSEMISDVSFAPDGNTFATSSWDRSLRCWDETDGRQKRRAPTLKYARCFDARLFSPDGNRIYSVTRGETIDTRDTKDGKLLQSRRWLDSAVRGFAISKDGTQLATSGHNREIKIRKLD